MYNRPWEQAVTGEKIMLLRLALAVADQQLETRILERFDPVSDLQIKRFNPGKGMWQSLVRSCADIFLFSDSIIPSPVDASFSVLNNLPENPMTIALHDNDSSEDHAHLLAAGVDVVLYSGILMDALFEAMETIIESRRQFNLMDRYDRKGRLKPRISDFISDSHHMQVFMEEVQQVVNSDTTLLILGETGVGKEHLAKAIHAEGPRSNGPFVAVNTAALPEQLLESELFGHEQGAFSGAIRARRGSFELAHGGTIFLDEIGDMPLHLQAKLLRVLQDYEIVPIGGEEPTWVDVRIMAATNKDLEAEIERGRFRRDLFYRIGVITLTIPPLAARKEDISGLVRNFISHFRKRIGREVVGATPETLAVMGRYEWPGNVRELMNVIERAMLLCRGDMITLESLPQGILNAGRDEREALETMRDTVVDTVSSALHGKDGVDGDCRDAERGRLVFDTQAWEEKPLTQVTREVQAAVERLYIERTLVRTRGRVGRAAALSGIHPRGFYNKMKTLGICKEDFKG